MNDESMRRFCVALMLGGSTTFIACERTTHAMTPQQLEQQYGVSGAYTDTIVTTDGRMSATIVPVTLADGRRAELIIPAQPGEPHAAYVRDQAGFHPVDLRDGVSRQDLIRSPAIVDTRPDAPHPKRHSWEKDALIIGGGAGGGALIGAVAGGKKGAAVGATAGGIGGLIYDLTTRHK